MKGKRFSEEQIIAVLRESEAGAKTRGAVSTRRDLGSDLSTTGRPSTRE